MEYGFILVNNNDVDSERASLTIRVEAYDKITLGSTTLYNIAIPNDGISSFRNHIKINKTKKLLSWSVSHF